MEHSPLVQWSFLQFRRTKGAAPPAACFLHSSTQIGSKILVYGGCDFNGDALSQLLIYDSASFLWSSPKDGAEFQEDHPGGRYGHTATLVEMHPPKVMIYGGMVNGGTFEFDAPDSPEGHPHATQRSFMSWRRRGKKSSAFEETDDAVYFLTLKADQWVWTKPMVQGGKHSRPEPRAEHTSCKTATNEVTVFGGWTTQPVNDLWVFNVVDMEWRRCVSSGIQPRPRYRHTAEVIGLKMFILGGSENSDDVAEESRSLGLHELNLETMQWSHPTLSGANPFPRSGHASAVVGAYSIAVFGGKRSAISFLNDLVLIDVQSFVATAVRAVEAHLPTGVSNASLSAVGNKCFVFGGTDAKGVCYTDIRAADIGGYLSEDDITVGEGASSDYAFKLLIIGDAAVGKSSLLTRFSDNTFLSHYTSTIGIDFNSRMIRVDNAICKLEIWDTAGQERFSTITANYYRGAQGCLLVYDVTQRESFERVQVWFERARQLGGQALESVLVGNKTDLPPHQRQVSTDEGAALAAQLGVPFVETSALNGANVETAFVTMTRNIKRSVDARGLTGIKDKNLRQAGGVTLASKEAKGGCGCG